MIGAIRNIIDLIFYPCRKFYITINSGEMLELCIILMLSNEAQFIDLVDEADGRFLFGLCITHEKKSK